MSHQPKVRIAALATSALLIASASSLALSAEPSLLHPEDLRVTAPSHSPADLDLERKIRDALVANGDLTNLGKNVAIDARDGHVTLTGLVTNLLERGLVGDIAGRVAGHEHIENDLEILRIA
jgi:hypothetical protein